MRQRFNGDGAGYINVQSKSGEIIGKHVHVAEAALGKQLPKGAEVHHIDGDKSNNDHKNLVICQDRSYHQLLHIRAKALEVCGNANFRKCGICKKYDDPENLVILKNPSRVYHNKCSAEYVANHRKKFGRKPCKKNNPKP